MTVLSGQTIRRLAVPHIEGAWTPMQITPFYEESKSHGMSYGLSVAGYDIRIGAIDRKDIVKGMREGRPVSESPLVTSLLIKPSDFVLLSSLEFIRLPPHIIGFVHDKSTLARRGLALQNTVLEPGWFGHITLEVSNHGGEHVRLEVGQPIAQVVFHFLDEPAERPYKGKYQDQQQEPQKAIYDV